MIAPVADGCKRLLGIVPQAKEADLESLILFQSHGPKLLACDELQLFANLRTKTTKGPTRQTQ
jgi:hypothetical protein